MTVEDVPLGQLVKVVGGYAFKSGDFGNTGYPVIRISNIQNGTIELEDTVKIEPEKIGKAEKYRLKGGDILMALSGATTGKLGVVPHGIEVPTYLNQRVGKFKIIDNTRVNKSYLRYFLESQNIQAQIWKSAAGVAQPNISPKQLETYNFPIVPIEEQKRIAAILDKADALREKRRQAMAKLDELLQSVFLNMFGDPVTNPKGWGDKISLGEVADIVSGITVGRKINGKETRKIPYMAVVNVQDRQLNLQTVKSIQATEEEIGKYRLLKNDLLLTEGGDPDKLGRGTLWNNELLESIHQNHIFRVRLNSGELNPIFLNWLIGSTRGKQYFLRSAKQTTGIASINMTQLRNFPLLIPPIKIQNSFSNSVVRTEMQRQKLIAHQNSLDSLFSSLQNRAFKGEL